MSKDDTFENIFRKRFGRSPTVEEIQQTIDQSVTSHNQSGGITAHTINFGPQQRRMDDKLKSEILSLIPKTTSISVIALMGDAEAYEFATEIYTFLKDNGFSLKEREVSQGMLSKVPKGFSYNPNDSTFIIGANIC